MNMIVPRFFYSSYMYESFSYLIQALINFLKCTVMNISNEINMLRNIPAWIKSYKFDTMTSEKTIKCINIEIHKNVFRVISRQIIIIEVNIFKTESITTNFVFTSLW